MTIRTEASSYAAQLAAVCPKAPPGGQAAMDEITGYVLWGVIAIMVAAIIIGFGAVLCGRIFAMPHASKVGVISVVVVLVCAIGLPISIAILNALKGNGCI